MLLLNFRHTKSNLLILAGGQLQTPIAIQFIDMITNNSWSWLNLMFLQLTDWKAYVKQILVRVWDTNSLYPHRRANKKPWISCPQFLSSVSIWSLTKSQTIQPCNTCTFKQPSSERDSTSKALAMEIQTYHPECNGAIKTSLGNKLEAPILLLAPKVELRYKFLFVYSVSN